MRRALMWHWGYHPGGEKSAPARSGCFCLQNTQPCASISVCRKTKMFRLTAVTGNCQDSHFDTLEPTVLPLTPSFDIFSWAGFSHHWEKQLMQKNTTQRFTVCERFMGWSSQLIWYSGLDEYLQGCWFKEHYTQPGQLLQLLSLTFLWIFFITVPVKKSSSKVMKIHKNVFQIT